MVILFSESLSFPISFLCSRAQNSTRWSGLPASRWSPSALGFFPRIAIHNRMAESTSSKAPGSLRKTENQPQKNLPPPCLPPSGSPTGAPQPAASPPRGRGTTCQFPYETDRPDGTVTQDLKLENSPGCLFLVGMNRKWFSEDCELEGGNKSFVNLRVAVIPGTVRISWFCGEAVIRQGLCRVKECGRVRCGADFASSRSHRCPVR